MIHWLRIWSRNLRRFKLYTFINVAGLSLAVSAVIAIYVYVTDELSYDDFHTRGDLIFRINTVTNFDGVENKYFTTSAPLADAIKTDNADIEKAVRCREIVDDLVTLHARFITYSTYKKLNHKLAELFLDPFGAS